MPGKSETAPGSLTSGGRLSLETVFLMFINVR